jgi:hypothetical protein
VTSKNPFRLDLRRAFVKEDNGVECAVGIQDIAGGRTDNRTRYVFREVAVPDIRINPIARLYLRV